MDNKDINFWKKLVGYITHPSVKSAWVKFYKKEIDLPQLKNILLKLGSNILDDNYKKYIKGLPNGIMYPESSGSSLSSFYDFDIQDITGLEDDEFKPLYDKVETSRSEIISRVNSLNEKKTMKKSQLKKEIKDYIYEILSEADLDPKGGSVVMSKQSNPTDIKKYTEKGIDVQLKEEDSSPDDETIDKQAKAAAKKEKIQGPSKFKFTNTEFEDFKTKLKNLVIKIKNMEKGAERDKKMAALKQFIKKPELVKAFKERDVKIDTGGLVGESKRDYPFYNTVKRGDKVKYVGPEKNGFKKGETYEVDHVKSSSTFQKTVVLKDGKRKIIVKGTNSIQPLD
jgi:hypothetical protein